MSLEIKAILFGIVLAVIMGGGWAVHHHIDQGGYNRAKAEYQLKLQEQADAAEKKYNQVAQQLEVARNEKKVIYQTITKYADRIIERPVYRTECVDDDGVRAINAALAGRPIDTAELAAAVPNPEPAGGKDRRGSAAQAGGSQPGL